MKENRFLSKVSSSLLLETMAEGTLMVDLEGKIRVWNKAMAEITGYSSDEAIGKSTSWLRAPDCAGAAKVIGLLESDEKLGNACVNGCECAIVSRSGEIIPVLVNARVLVSEKGEILGIIQTLTDFRPVFNLKKEIEAMTKKITGEGSFHGIIGKSIKMQKIFKLIGLAAESEATVMVLGDSGTGKELVTTAIHDMSSRATKPLIKVNCGAIPETLLESELFGHEKGSFTGAIKKRMGRFEAADGGTIFLDEVGDISPAMQVKLLRVLQEGEFERIGGEKTLKVDVRVVCATNKDLQKEVKESRFREDLYYRLRVFPINIPALSQRPEDIPPLTQHFINRFSAKTGKLISGISREALDQLFRYSWPGNIRELENAIEYAFVVCQDSQIKSEHLPEEVLNSEAKETLTNVNYQANSEKLIHFDSETAKQTVRSKSLLTELLTDCAWNKAEAARRLGLSRTAVWKWIKKHRIPLKRE
jgi:PAS domain S-box-containing protein